MLLYMKIYFFIVVVMSCEMLMGKGDSRMTANILRLLYEENRDIAWVKTKNKKSFYEDYPELKDSYNLYSTTHIQRGIAFSLSSSVNYYSVLESARGGYKKMIQKIDYDGNMNASSYRATHYRDILHSHYYFMPYENTEWIIFNIDCKLVGDNLVEDIDGVILEDCHHIVGNNFIGGNPSLFFDDARFILSNKGDLDKILKRRYSHDIFRKIAGIISLGGALGDDFVIVPGMDGRDVYYKYNPVKPDGQEIELMLRLFHNSDNAAYFIERYHSDYKKINAKMELIPGGREALLVDGVTGIVRVGHYVAVVKNNSNLEREEFIKKISDVRRRMSVMVSVSTDHVLNNNKYEFSYSENGEESVIYNYFLVNNMEENIVLDMKERRLSGDPKKKRSLDEILKKLVDTDIPDTSGQLVWFRHRGFDIRVKITDCTEMSKARDMLKNEVIKDVKEGELYTINESRSLFYRKSYFVELNISPRRIADVDVKELFREVDVLVGK